MMQFDKELEEMHQNSFNIHRFTEKIGRKATLSVMTISAIKQLGLDKEMKRLDWHRMTTFLSKIYEGYRRDVEYHNDLHAADVMQMAFVMLTEGNLIEKAELQALDALAILISAVCHDFGHDGFNNGFHVNAVTDRAIRYSD